jgi:lipopolysaccharide/colanic/teichoic acid biosynthesis glycosyltransferase
MTWSKRLFDLVVALIIAIPLVPVMAVIALTILILDGRPVFYVSERMQTPTRAFRLVKFRTMRPAATDSGVSGGDKADRITRTGRFLRRTRLDELPQLWNILTGDISFVGPRPPLRQYVEAYPALYARVLRSRPGVTGLATLAFARHEAHLLARCRTAAETDAVYRRACIPRKARLDLIYQARRSICMDIRLMARTVWR